MTRVFFTIFSLVAVIASWASNGTLLIEGKYQNKNIYIQNAFNQNGVGFCAYEVRVNGNLTTDEVNSSAFEIDLRPFNLNSGDPVTIQIFHKEGCVPKVLNPEALKPRPTFSTKAITINNEGLLTWTTTGETGSLTFVVEQFRWNKWVYVGEVQGIGTAAEHTYSFKVSAHSGENRFRVKQVGFGKEVKYTPEVRYIPQNMQAMTFEQSSDSRTIKFSGETLYEMYDIYGNIVLKGYGTKADITEFGKGIYYMCFDNQIIEVQRK
ncbi:MAG: hypothetical protein Fur0041_10990 [Bacteroidia bacterium]